MDKRKLHHIWTKIRKLHAMYFLTLALLFVVIAVITLRQNNLTVLNLRDHLLEVDKNNGDVEKALRDLRAYTYSHMNTDLATNTSVYPPIQLVYRYQRLQQAEKDRISSIMSKVYNDAQKHCEALNSTDVSGRNRVPCIQQYVTTHGVTEQPIPDAVYKFAFASPVWSPDLAGWSIVLAIAFALLFIIRSALEIWLKRTLKM